VHFAPAAAVPSAATAAISTAAGAAIRATGGTALRLVGVALLSVILLVVGGEDEFLAAVLTDECLVLIAHDGLLSVLLGKGPII